MIERTKYLELIIKTYFETKYPSESNPSEPMFDLQIQLFKHALIRQQKVAEQKEFITKGEFYLQCELAMEELKEYGYMQYSIDAAGSTKNKLHENEINIDQETPISDEEQTQLINKQINTFLVDLSKLDHDLKFHIYNWEIEFLDEIFENLNQSSFQSIQNEKIELITLSSNMTNERTDFIPELFGEMFSNNGFELFEHILNKYVNPLNTRGRKSDLIFYYWKLFNSEPQYIHQRPTTFFNWFENKYDEMTGQLKTFDKVKTIQRETDFSSAIEWFKSK